MKLLEKKHLILFFLFIPSNLLFSMVHDNRWVPLYERPRIYFGSNQSLFQVEAFSATASSAFNNTEKTIGIPELYGKFDLNKLTTAIEKIGLSNPLRTDLRGKLLPYTMDGRIQMQGLTIQWQQFIFDWLSFGTSLLFARANTHQQFFLDEKETRGLILAPGDKLELDKTRRDAFALLGFDNNHSAQLGFGDVDAHVRIGREWCYVLKCRHVELGLTGGVLIPSGIKRDIFAPASIPFGGDGHWGFYLQADGLFEIKEDIKVGFVGRVSGRRSKTIQRRMSINGEPHVFGAVVGDLQIDPGITAFICPHIILENLREGFGLQVLYTLTHHDEDEWRDRRTNKEIETNLADAIKRTEWASDYMSIGAFYDFGAVKKERAFDPILSITWDFPVMFFVSKRFPKTHRVSVGIEFDY